MQRFMRMTATLGVAAIAVLQGCSTADVLAETEAVRDYIAAAELEETDRIRTRALSRTDFTPINEQFLVFETRDEFFLVELRNRCFELYNNALVVPDVRHDSTSLRPGFDTIRGCVIGKIYPVDEAQALELEQLGDAPGDESIEGRVEPNPPTT